MRKSSLRQQRNSYIGSDDESVAEYSNENMLFRVFSPKKADIQESLSSFPTKFTMNIRRGDDEIPYQVGQQRQQQTINYRPKDHNTHEIGQLRKQSSELQSKLEKYKGKYQEAKKTIGELQNVNRHYQKCNDGLVVQSQDNIRKFENYISTINTQFRQKNESLTQQNQRLTQQLEQNIQKGTLTNRKLSQSEQEIKNLKSQLAIKHQELLNKDRVLEQQLKYQKKQTSDTQIRRLQQLQKQVAFLKQKCELLTVQYEGTLAEKESIILKMSKFNNQICQKMLKERYQIYGDGKEDLSLQMTQPQKEDDFNNLLKSEAFLRVQNNRVEDENSLLKQQLRKMQTDNARMRSFIQEQKQRIEDMEGLILQKDKQIQQYSIYLQDHIQSQDTIPTLKLRYSNIIADKDSLIESLRVENEVWQDQITQISKKLSAHRKSLQQKERHILILERQLRNSQLQFHFKQEGNQPSYGRITKQSTPQQEVHNVLRQRIKSAEHLRKVSSHNFVSIPVQEDNQKQSIEQQMKSVSKAFNLLTLQLEKIIEQRVELGNQTGKGGISPKMAIYKSKQHSQGMQSHHQDKMHSQNRNAKWAEIVKLRQLIVNQKQSYKNIQKNVLESLKGNIAQKNQQKYCSTLRREIFSNQNSMLQGDLPYRSNENYYTGNHLSNALNKETSPKGSPHTKDTNFRQISFKGVQNYAEVKIENRGKNVHHKEVENRWNAKKY